MEETKKAEMIAEAENIEAIRDFFIEWWSVEELYETEAKACTAIMHLLKRATICDEEKSEILALIDQHQMMVEHLKPFAGKEAKDE